MNYKLYLDLFGYLGTALIFLSMMMTNMVKLRLVNMAGSLISMIYAILTQAWPVVVLNGGLILINTVQLIRAHKKK